MLCCNVMATFTQCCVSAGKEENGIAACFDRYGHLEKAHTGLDGVSATHTGLIPESLSTAWR